MKISMTSRASGARVALPVSNAGPAGTTSRWPTRWPSSGPQRWPHDPEPQRRETGLPRHAGRRTLPSSGSWAKGERPPFSPARRAQARLDGGPWGRSPLARLACHTNDARRGHRRGDCRARLGAVKAPRGARPPHAGLAALTAPATSLGLATADGQARPRQGHSVMSRSVTAQGFKPVERSARCS